MGTLSDTMSDLWRSLRERPDELMLDVGAGGELLVARLRIGVAGVLILLPVANYLTDGTAYESAVGLFGVGVVLLLSQLWLALAKRRHRWLPFLSGAFDVSMITLVLALLALQAPPMGLNSLIVWACYPLAIVATALRNDGRVTLFTGGLALLQYALLASTVLAGANDGTPLYLPDYGTVTISSQLQRALLLLIFTLITAVIVFRTQRLVQLSGTDGLTGLPNRSYLVHRVPEIVADARTEGGTLTLALIDLDHFKHINEDLGHLAGDRALRHAVRILREAVGRAEPLIRVGGEEFVLILQLPMGAAWERIEALRQRLADQPFLPEAGAEPRTLTFSAGLACYPHDATDVSGLMRKADLRLRQGKRGGRNRVVARDS